MAQSIPERAERRDLSEPLGRDLGATGALGAMGALGRDVDAWNRRSRHCRPGTRNR